MHHSKTMNLSLYDNSRSGRGLSLHVQQVSTFPNVDGFSDYRMYSDIFFSLGQEFVLSLLGVLSLRLMNNIYHTKKYLGNTQFLSLLCVVFKPSRQHGLRTTNAGVSITLYPGRYKGSELMFKRLCVHRRCCKDTKVQRFMCAYRPIQVLHRAYKCETKCYGSDLLV